MYNQQSTEARTKILLVDKDIRRANSIYPHLYAAQYEVFVVNSIADALKVLDHNTVDLVAINTTILGKLSVDFARVLQHRFVTPFVIITDNVEDICIDPMVEQGALACLFEPVDPKQLATQIEIALSRSADLAKLRAANQGLKLLLSDKRKTSIAVGMMMERYRVSRDDAYEALCSLAKAQKKILYQIVDDVVSSG